MHKQQTYREQLYGPPPGAEAFIRVWNADVINRLLGYVWEAYDDLYANNFSQVDWTQGLDDVEREISEDLELAIRDKMDSYSSIVIQHSPGERETRKGSKFQSPTYDLAFKIRSDTRIMWPLEAKVLQSDKNTDTNIGNYIETIHERFFGFKYAPFSNGAAMLAYMKAGDPETVTHHIAARLGTALTPCAAFPTRCHKISDHQRTVPPTKDYPASFRLHHLVLSLS